MKILITGGAGFIGSHIAKAYLGKGHKVVILDKLITGKRKNLPKKAKFYKADIEDLAKIEAIFSKERPEVVNHHAAIAEVAKALRDPLPTLKVNVLGTTNIALAFGKHSKGKKKKLIFASTGGVMYGSPKKLPVGEDATPNPSDPYGLSKFLGEEIVKFYAKHFGFSHLIFRYSNVYGPGQNPKGEAGVVAIFGGLMKQGMRPTIFGDGTKTRDYTFIDDIVEMNVKALHKGEGEILNLGHGKEISDAEIYKLIAETSHFGEPPIHGPFRKGEVKNIALDASRARKVLGWKPRVSLKDGIQKTLKTI